MTEEMEKSVEEIDVFSYGSPCLPVVPILGKQRQEGQELKANLGYIMKEI